MRPDDNRPSTPIVVPPRQSTSTSGSQIPGGDQAAELVRGQIDTIYHNDPNVTTVAEQPEPAKRGPVAYTPPSKTKSANVQVDNQAAEVQSPYERTHNEQQHQIEPTAWQKYHSAWQSYYQQYYERYYVSQVRQAKQALEEQASKTAKPSATNHDDEIISTDEAMYDLRSKLRDKISQRAAKVRKSRHFIPLMAVTAFLLAFAFLQYNRVLFAAVEAYVTPGNMDPSTLIVDPSTQIQVGPEPRLIIPKINVDVPIIWDAVASSQSSLNNAMDHGVAWFSIPGANARPGEVGNFVLSGHSSNDWLDGGDYKFVFARLEQLTEGDVIYVNYNSVRYTYSITRRSVVLPTAVNALVEPTTKPLITLITCVPLGTANKRLLVFAEQVSPDPKSATASSAPQTTASSAATSMPSNSPTFLQRLFGGGN